ncbi:hypothetical protein BBJ28_00020525 [Nothophytophthora sp. Chile5]|nr:hypothetical protein BBJ28_00020525 [Nothophytophthora sp. Chile5]
MLTSEAAKDPNKPFKLRVEDLRRKEKLLNLMEKSPKNVDLHRQIQTAGHLVQVVGDFRHFLETGNAKPEQAPQ